MPRKINTRSGNGPSTTVAHIHRRGGRCFQIARRWAAATNSTKTASDRMPKPITPIPPSQAMVRPNRYSRSLRCRPAGRPRTMSSGRTIAVPDGRRSRPAMSLRHPARRSPALQSELVPRCASTSSPTRPLSCLTHNAAFSDAEARVWDPVVITRTCRARTSTVSMWRTAKLGCTAHTDTLAPCMSIQTATAQRRHKADAWGNSARALPF